MHPHTDTERILLLWDLRPCWICELRGPCIHREIDVARAEIECEDLRMRNRIRKPAASEPAKVRRIR